MYTVINAVNTNMSSNLPSAEIRKLIRIGRGSKETIRQRGNPKSSAYRLSSYQPYDEYPTNSSPYTTKHPCYNPSNALQKSGLRKMYLDNFNSDNGDDRHEYNHSSVDSYSSDEVKVQDRNMKLERLQRMALPEAQEIVLQGGMYDRRSYYEQRQMNKPGIGGVMYYYNGKMGHGYGGIVQGGEQVVIRKSSSYMQKTKAKGYEARPSIELRIDGGNYFKYGQRISGNNRVGYTKNVDLQMQQMQQMQYTQQYSHSPQKRSYLIQIVQRHSPQKSQYSPRIQPKNAPLMVKQSPSQGEYFSFKSQQTVYPQSSGQNNLNTNQNPFQPQFSYQQSQNPYQLQYQSTRVSQYASPRIHPQLQKHSQIQQQVQLSEIQYLQMYQHISQYQLQLRQHVQPQILQTEYSQMEPSQVYPSLSLVHPSLMKSCPSQLRPLQMQQQGSQIRMQEHSPYKQQQIQQQQYQQKQQYQQQQQQYQQQQQQYQQQQQQQQQYHNQQQPQPQQIHLQMHYYSSKLQLQPQSQSSRIALQYPAQYQSNSHTKLPYIFIHQPSQVHLPTPMPSYAYFPAQPSFPTIPHPSQTPPNCYTPNLRTSYIFRAHYPLRYTCPYTFRYAKFSYSQLTRPTHTSPNRNFPTTRTMQSRTVPNDDYQLYSNYQYIQSPKRINCNKSQSGSIRWQSRPSMSNFSTNIMYEIDDKQYNRSTREHIHDNIVENVLYSRRKIDYIFYAYTRKALNYLKMIYTRSLSSRGRF